MVLETWYNSGTVSVAAGSPMVSGIGTLWGGDAIMAGDLFCDPAQPLVPPQRVKAVTANGALELWAPWPGTALAAKAYEIRYVGIIERSTAQTRKVLEQLGDVGAWFDIMVEDNAARLALETAGRPLEENYRVLVRSLGVIWAKKTGAYGDWIGPVEFRGPPGPASTIPGVVWRFAYDPETTYAINDGVTFNGSSFRKITAAAAGAAPSSASPPVNTAAWEVLAAKGTNGTGTGDVVGPATALDGRLAVFDGNTGKVLKDGSAKQAMNSRTNISVNGSLLDALENPANPVLTANSSFYADQHALYRSADLATNISVQRVAYTSLAGGSAAAEFKVPVAKPALAATSIATDTEVIEGSRPDFVAAGWGATGAKPFVHRKEVQKPAGTYSIHVTNRAADWHCWVPYVVTAGEANTKVVKEIVIPGAVAGSWFKGDGLIGMVIDDVLCAGSNFVGGAAGVWGGSAFYAGAGQKNLLDATANVARHADFGTRLDPDATGFYGSYKVGEKDREYCSERYVFRINVLAIKGVVANGIGAAVCTCPVSTRLAKAPTIMSNVGNLLFGDGFSNVEFSSVVAGSMTREVVSFQPAGIVSGSFGTAGRPVVGLASGDIIAIARPS